MSKKSKCVSVSVCSPKNLHPMGIPNKLGGSDVVFKRAFRWTFQFIVNDKEMDLSEEAFVKSVVLPKLLIENGKKAWTQLVVEYYDMPDNEQLWTWINGPHVVGETVATVKYYDGCGVWLDQLVMTVQPAKVEFSDPDYTKSDVSTIRIVFNVASVEHHRSPEAVKAMDVVWGKKQIPSSEPVGFDPKPTKKK